MRGAEAKVASLSEPGYKSWIGEQARGYYADFRGDHNTVLARRMVHTEAGSSTEEGSLIGELLSDIKESHKKEFLKRAIVVGLDIYFGKKRGNNKTDYACHPARVALAVKDNGGDEIAMAKAFLHDAIEILVEESSHANVSKEKLDKAKKDVYNRLKGFPILRRKTFRSVDALTRYGNDGKWLDDPDYLPFISDIDDAAIKCLDRADSGMGDVAQADTEFKKIIPNETAKKRKGRISKAVIRAKDSQDKNKRTLEALQNSAPKYAIDYLNIAISLTDCLLEEFKDYLPREADKTIVSTATPLVS